MRLRDRNRDDGQPATGGAPGENNLDEIGAQAARLLAAGDDAIERALSNNSEAFLAANRQHGGQ